MNDSNRNIRTLIVSFVFAIMALIPLRFIEVGQSIESYSGSSVLGETTQPVILPNATVKAEPVLEAPYNQIEAKKVLGATSETQTLCVPKAQAETIIGQFTNLIESKKLTRSELDDAIKQMMEVENKTCK